LSKIRQKRTADQIQNILSELILRELRDPRLADLTITEVTIDRELQYATIYVSALGDDTREKEVMEALHGAIGFLRRELARSLPLKTVPQLAFHWDPTLAQAERISRLLDSLEIPEESVETGEESGD
jgi:ribosome-binding factor A